jgi:hypothetical protein
MSTTQVNRAENTNGTKAPEAPAKKSYDFDAIMGKMTERTVTTTVRVKKRGLTVTLNGELAGETKEDFVALAKDNAVAVVSLVTKNTAVRGTTEADQREKGKLTGELIAEVFDNEIA